MPLAPRPPERADRDDILKPQSAAVRQPDTATATATGKLQLNAILGGFSKHGSSRPHQSHPKAR
jgi:hypothetical protein